MDDATFDRWYAEMVASPVKDAIVQRHLGLPRRLLSTSGLNWDAIAEVVAALHLRAGEVLVDLACGRGGYGLEIATRTATHLIGVDFSGEAVRQAGEHARAWEVTAEFRVGDLAATGLAAATADAVVCVDAIQFAQVAERPEAAYDELRRVLRPGGRAALTCWEPVDRSDDGVPEFLRRVDLGAGLRAAGFEDVVVADRPDWLTREEALWREAATLDPGEDAALRAFHEEGRRALRLEGRLRRVLATATAPPGS